MSGPSAGRAVPASVVRLAARRAGSPGRVAFTADQLRYEIGRVFAPGIPALPPVPSRWLPSSAGVDAAIRRFGPMPGLLPAAEIDRGAGPVLDGDGGFADLYDYGLPRVLICQHRSIAAMLLANDVHLSAACPVLTAAALPWSERFLTAAEAGRAVAYVLHDASTAGYQFVRRVAESLTGHPSIGCRSLGLRPDHARLLRLPVRRGPRVADEAALPPYLSVRERSWLMSGRGAELAAVAPARLVRTVHRLVREVPARPSRLAAWRGLPASGFMSWPAANGGSGGQGGTTEGNG